MKGVTLSLNDRTTILHQFNVDPITRRIYLSEEIDPAKTEQVVKNIHFLSHLNEKPISLWISSPGGDIACMLYIYDIIRTSYVPIKTIGGGEICSAASVILAAGHARYAMPNALLMAHDVAGTFEGSHDVIKASMDAFRKQREKLFSVLEKHSKLSKDEWKKRTKSRTEIWLSANEMYDWGLVDSILVPPKELNEKANKNVQRKSQRPRATKARR